MESIVQLLQAQLSLLPESVKYKHGLRCYTTDSVSGQPALEVLRQEYCQLLFHVRNLFVSIDIHPFSFS